MPTFGQSLEADKAQAVQAVNDGIAAVRRQFITDLPGQENIYRRKEEMAREYLALDPEPATLDGFGLIAREVGLTAPTAKALAELWVQMAQDWEYAAELLEEVRLTAYSRIEAAQDRQAVFAAQDLFGAELAAALAELAST